ncbi:hypothetical protein I79_023454 [Cricetulus griseus]|uniref:Uncharacterized protein n=1 Tax=Cricetulus griseus TaxID=10029 RepID=G3IHZ4_CRIGR|nr:hypothetical protein I79_023454 [Cricetulus griseus]
MSSFARASKEKGSIPFWLITTNPLSESPQTFFFSSIIFLTLSSMNFLSTFTSFSRSSALL